MEYSAKFRVSLSTLRRRIKAGDIEFKLIDGKYLLKDGSSLNSRPATEAIAPPTSVKASEQETVETKSQAVPPATSVVPASVIAEAVQHDQFWKTTQGLLSEIKKAYSLVLQEKE